MAFQSGCIWKFCSAGMLIFLLLGLVSAVRVSEKIYEPIQGNMSCFKRFNGTSEFGCTSNFGGNVGVLYIPVNESDAKWAMEDGPHPPYILGLKDGLFTKNVLMSAKNSGNVNGIILLHQAENTPENFSPASSCPSQEYGIYNSSSHSQYKDYCSAEQPWNSVGNSLLFESFDFPIFLIKDLESIESIITCYNQFNVANNESTTVNWPLCALELYSNMFGTTNSEVCLRRNKQSSESSFGYVNYCDPIHDYNIIGSLNPMTGKLGDSSVIVVAARTDAGSLFDNISPGANSAVSGLVTLLAVAEALHKYKENFKAAEKHVMFMLFEAETWDYLGSASTAYDVSEGNFPRSPDESEPDRVSQFNFSSIDYFIELSQLGIQGSETAIYLHSDPISNSDPEINEHNTLLNAALKDAGRLANVTVNFAVDNNNTPYPLPPASIQSFLKYRNISGAVLADHAKDFKNLYYQSFLDNEKNVDFKSTLDHTQDSDKLHSHLMKIASTVSSAVYKIATNNTVQIEADGDLIGEMLVCFLRNINCTLFRENSGNLVLDYPSYFQPTPAKMYSSVYRGEDILSNITLYLMGRFLGDEVEEDVHECWSNRTSAIQKFFMPIMGNGTCFVSTARTVSAVSPAFTIHGYNFSSGEFPSWTESGWASTSARLFLKPDPAEEIALVVGGLLLIIIAALVSYWATTKATTLFECTPPPVQC